LSSKKIPRTPKALSPESKRLWRDLHDLYDLQDAYAMHWLETALRHHDLMLQARQAINEEGAVVRGRDGGLVRNPASLIYRDAAQAMERSFKMLDLAPPGVE
jgi:P27 family predicted phage terminase small subunit